MKLKQLFCRHIYKEMRREDLYKAREPTGPITYANFLYIAKHQECVKCEKLRIVTDRILLV